MKRKFIPIIALVAVAAISISVGLVLLLGQNQKPKGPSFSEGFDFAEVEGGWAVVDYAGTDVEVVIPEKYNGKPVVSIGTAGYRANGTQDGFYANDKIVTVHVPDSVTTIWKMAFSECENLIEVTGCKNVRTVGDSAFANCSKLKKAALGNKLEVLGESAFSNCQSLETVSLPNTVKRVASSAFFRCNALNMTVEKGVKFVGNAKNPHLVALLAESSEITTAVIPDSTKIISDLAFMLCTKLTTVSVGSGVEFVGKDAFITCNNLTYRTVNGVNYLGNDKNPCVIAMGVAQGAEKAVALSDDCRILYNGFTLGLTETLTIGKSLLYVPEKTLGTNALTAFAVSEQNAALKAIDGVLYTKDGKTLLAYPSQKEDASFTVGGEVTTIAAHAFLDANNLSSLTISQSVTTIEAGAFLNAVRLTEVVFTVPTGWVCVTGGTESPLPESIVANTSLIAIKLITDYQNAYARH
ncbi:MAG: leucine-rich repeat protein [Clostridia bacterium]|nr:leucine-rich repeat protein [Clostridia bacterium]